MRTPTRRPALLVAALFALGAAGCSSTVQITHEVTTAAGGTAAGPGGQTAIDPLTGQPTTVAPGGQALGGTGTTPLAESGGSVAAGGGTVGTGGTTGTTVVTAGGGSLPATGRGWDQKYVYIGVVTQKDVQAAFGNAGAKGLDAGDQEGQALAVAAELNRRGGLFSRQVKIVFRDVHTVETAQDPNTAGNATCTYFSQDHPVIALLSPVTLMDVPSFRSCMARARIPLFSASVNAVDKQVGEALKPYFYQSVAPTWDALAPTLMARLKAQSYFTGWNASTGAPAPGAPVVGILAPNDDIGGRIVGVVRKALAAVGYPKPVVYQYASGGDMSSAVLQFSGNGVTHVITVNSDLLPFQLSANSQQYRPRYAVTTVNAPQAFLESNSPPGQNNGAVGVGWAPSFDVNDANDNVTTPAEKECLAIMAKGGQTFSGKRLAETVAFAFCDGLRLMVGGAAAGGGLDGLSLYAGVQRIAASFESAFSFATGLGPGRLYVPGGVRDMTFVSGCSCFRYAGTATYRI
ncbi:MAG: hypothetical protein QOE05_3110 [Actinomycetota bacterium]|jgi:hypothetical protein|nr:hypothetical protein [Actinomycetota bacterium]